MVREWHRIITVSFIKAYEGGEIFSFSKPSYAEYLRFSFRGKGGEGAYLRLAAYELFGH